jgi:hypothetical protein
MKTSRAKIKQLIKMLIKEDQFYVPHGMDLETIKNLKATSDRDPEGGLEGVLSAFTKLLPVSHGNIVLYIFEGIDEKFDYKFDDNQIFHIAKRSEIHQQPFKDLVDKHPGKKIIFLNKRFYHKLTDFISAKNKPEFKLADVFTPFYILHDFSHTVLHVDTEEISLSKFYRSIGDIDLLIQDEIIDTLTDGAIDSYR